MESYEKKYKDALGWMQSVYPTMTGADKEDAEHFFPELKESEDERIRKGIIRNLQYLADRAEGFVKDELAERIAWLEKQGEQILANSAKTCKDEQKPAAWSEEDKKKLKPQQKPAWSEEDEKNLQGILDEIEANKSEAPEYDIDTYNRFIDWLKSLKDRVGCEAICTTTWKPSEEQISLLKEAVNIVGSRYKSCLNSLYSDLKKL